MLPYLTSAIEEVQHVGQGRHGLLKFSLSLHGVCGHGVAHGFDAADRPSQSALGGAESGSKLANAGDDASSPNMARMRSRAWSSLPSSKRGIALSMVMASMRAPGLTALDVLGREAAQSPLVFELIKAVLAAGTVPMPTSSHWRKRGSCHWLSSVQTATHLTQGHIGRIVR